MASILSADGLCFSYSEERPVLENLTFSIEQGSFVALLGPNGSGKSTLAKLLGGIYLPSRGRVRVLGVDTASKEAEQVRTRVGMVFQNPDNQIVSSIVEEDVAFAPENLGIPQPELSERVDRALEAVGMIRYRTHSTSLLSGGQKQRIAIAGALAMCPELLVLDEPTAMLDPKGRADVCEVVHRLNREQGITVCQITHHMEEAAMADRVIVLHGGKILLDGTPQEVFAQAALLKSVGLAVPQSVELKLALEEAGMTLAGDVTDARSCAEAIAAALKEGGR